MTPSNSVSAFSDDSFHVKSERYSTPNPERLQRYAGDWVCITFLGERRAIKREANRLPTDFNLR